MIKKMRIAVDHGNRNMKTCNTVFTTGIEANDLKPGRDTEYLTYQGKYYTLSSQRMPYQRDKTQDFRYFALTLIAIAKELELNSKIEPNDIVQVQLPIVEIFEMYRPLLIRKSIVNGSFDEDLYQELAGVLLLCIQRFQVLE